MSINGRNLIAQNDNDEFINVKCKADGSIKTSLGGDNLTAFGEVLTAQLTPVIQENFPYTVNTRVWNITTTDTGSIAHDNAKAVLSTGTTASSVAQLVSKKRIKYRTGMGVVVRFTALWEEGVGSSYISFIGIGDGVFTNGFYFYKDENDMKLIHFNNGIETTYGTVALPLDDPCDGSGDMPAIDWSLGNVFQIRYQYLGYGAIRFYIENPNTGLFQLIHTIKYANSQEEPSLSNATLPFNAYIANEVGGVVDTKLKTASVACFVEGVDKLIGIPNVYTFTDTATATEDNAFTIRNNTLFNGVSNQSLVYPQYINISNTESKTAVVSLISNTTLGGVPAYTDIDTKTSIVSVDTAGTTITDGTVLATILVAPTTSERINLKEYGIQIVPSETLTIAHTTVSGSASIIFTLGWIEDQ